jgi:hypothetical protein
MCIHRFAEKSVGSDTSANSANTTNSDGQQRLHATAVLQPQLTAHKQTANLHLEKASTVTTANNKAADLGSAGYITALLPIGSPLQTCSSSPAAP